MQTFPTVIHNYAYIYSLKEAQRIKDSTIKTNFARKQHQQQMLDDASSTNNNIVATGYTLHIAASSLIFLNNNH